jgi:hypothetical protein
MVQIGPFLKKCAGIRCFLQLEPEIDPPDGLTGAELGLFSSGISDSLIGFSQPGAKNSLPKPGVLLPATFPTPLS